VSKRVLSSPRAIRLFALRLSIGVCGLALHDEVVPDLASLRSMYQRRRTLFELELIVKTQDRYRVVNLDYHGGLRFPHLVRDPLVPALLDALLSPR
jgi:hypothetical protein